MPTNDAKITIDKIEEQTDNVHHELSPLASHSLSEKIGYGLFNFFAPVAGSVFSLAKATQKYYALAKRPNSEATIEVLKQKIILYGGDFAVTFITALALSAWLLNDYGKLPLTDSSRLIDLFDHSGIADAINKEMY